MLTRLFPAAAAALVLTFAAPLLAQEHPEALHIHDVYARSNGGIGGSGAVFFMIHNNTETDDRLIAVTSDVAEKTELHTHVESADGVMQMVQIEGGIALPSGEMHELARGGDHVMLMGLTRAVKDGDTIALTLTFEKAGEVQIQATVDNARKPGEGGMDHMDHSGHDMKHGDAAAGHSGHGQNAHSHSAHRHGAHGQAAAVDQSGLTDVDAITAVMKAQFDTPENPLLVAPVVVEGEHALASWEQGGKGGRALLAKGHMGWEIILCGGKDLQMPSFLGQHGVAAPESLSQMFNAEEEKLGADKVALSSSFEGVVMISGQ